MKAIFIVLAFLLSGCAVSVKESYRNPEYKQELDKISVKWVPPKELSINTKYVGNTATIIIDKTMEATTVRKHLYDLQTRTQELLAKELLYYNTNIVKENLSNYILQLSPTKFIKIYCGSGSCQSIVDMRLTMKESSSGMLIWSSSIKVTSPTPPFTRTDMDGKEELVTPDTTQEMVQSIIDQWNKYQLLPARLASPRLRLPLEETSKAETDRLDQKDRSYEKLLAWIRENNKWGKDAPIVKEFERHLETAIGGTKASWAVGWGLTKSGKAYEIGWTKKSLSIAELAPEEAAVKGFREMKNIFAVE